MNTELKIRVGDVLSNDDIVSKFRCGNAGGMRGSNSTNSLVLVSDHTKTLYENRWIDDELHYTGMGKNGDQSLDFRYNKTLTESIHNGVDVHLFEVFSQNRYIYRGVVYLSGEPHQDIQDGDDGVARKVWIFPLKVKTGEILLDSNDLEKNRQEKQKEAKKLSDKELKRRAAQNESKKPSRRRIASYAYVRDAFIAELSKRRANGVCQLCRSPAPFLGKDGEPYLESHHIMWLTSGGEDTTKNTVALCPNCHRKMHVLDLDSDKDVLHKHLTWDQ